MKKAIYLLVVYFFILSISSCTPQTIIADSDVPQACCGDDLDVPPPPPPLPLGV